MFKFHQFPIAVLTIGLATTTMPGCMSSLLKMEMPSMSSFKPPALEGTVTETRTINLFTDSLAENNEKAFRGSVSTRFEQQAMRSSDSFNDLEILDLPKTKLEIVDSQQIDENTRETVTKTENGTKYQFRLIRDPDKRRWVVDDIMIRQQKKGTSATKSSTEVMDLLLTVREFIATWQSGDRSEIIAAVSDDLRQPLESLPSSWMHSLVSNVASECEEGMARRPEAQLNESDAVVKMPSRKGFLLLKVVRQDDQWLISDVEVRQRKTDDHPGSILRQARALNSVAEFLAAYQRGDKEALKTMADDAFFRSSLSSGNLAMIRLPAGESLPSEFEIRSFSGQLTVMVPAKEQVVQLDLTTPGTSKKSDTAAAPVDSPVENRFLVRDITIYDRNTRKQQKLESAFTAPARANLFIAALHDGEVEMLKQLSTNDLNQRTWDRIDPSLVGSLPLANVPAGELTLQSTNVRGDTTELEFLSESGQACFVTLRNENDVLRVDDVEYPDFTAGVASLKEKLQLTVPLVELASAWEKGDLNRVKMFTSGEFNRLVWSNVTSLPRDFGQLPTMLLSPIVSSKISDGQATLEVSSSPANRMEVRLLLENTSWVVDEISMPQTDGTAFNVRQTLRQDIARSFLSEGGGSIQQAEHETNDPDQGVVRAAATTSTQLPDNVTVQPSYRSGEVPKNLLSTPTTPSRQQALPAGRVRTVNASEYQTRNSGRKLGADEYVKKAPVEEVDGTIFFKGADDAGPSGHDVDFESNDDLQPGDPGSDEALADELIRQSKSASASRARRPGNFRDNPIHIPE